MSDIDLQRWDSRYASMDDQWAAPSRILQQLDDFLPSNGRALDVAGGDGRNAVWLAARGLDVTLADISAVGLKRAESLATRRGVKLRTRQLDFDRQPIPAGPWDLILSMLFYCPRHFAEFSTVLAPGGLLVYVQPTRRNLERHERPPAPFLLADGALPSLVQQLEVVRYEEGWLADGRHDALLIARRTDASLALQTPED